MLRRSDVALAGGTALTVAVLVSFTELPSIFELSRFEGDQRG